MIPWSGKCHFTLVLLPGKPHEEKCLVGCSLWGPKEFDRTVKTHKTHTQSKFIKPAPKSIIEFVSVKSCLVILYSYSLSPKPQRYLLF